MKDMHNLVMKMVCRISGLSFFVIFPKVLGIQTINKKYGYKKLPFVKRVL